MIDTNAMQNMMWASRIVTNPCGTRAFTNIVSIDDPSTISGDAIARKITKFMIPCPRYR